MTRQSLVESERCPHLSALVPDLWTLLNDQEREQLLISAAFYLFKKGDVIFLADSTPTHCYILSSGEVMITRDGIGDKRQILRMIRPLDLFGYQAHFAGQAYTSSAIALGRSIVCAIPIDVLESIISSNSSVGLYLVRRLSSKLFETDRLTISLAQKHTRGRLAESLLMLKAKYGLEADNATINIHLSRQELADYANMTASNATRTLYAFEEEAVIDLDGRKIRLRDEPKLIAISQMG